MTQVESGSRMHWTQQQLAKFSSADDFYVAPFRADGKTYGTPTFIWSVVAKGRLFVRAYNGTASSWYKSTLEQKAGRIVLTGRSFKVAFNPAAGLDNDLIDQEYKEKYASSRYLKAMISDKARETTLEVTPTEPQYR